ncbi:MAG: LLM class flavin-dependent oxidoreductase [Rhodospirillaceae bacterium]|jgi:alkanesulfonate monooxygenase SsuD/methylene tetrahydromethanopterin reductase-like flavin-dependent oxidoreductase (luciferase family)|nr:LLM class flavin-dependent oxidoreductase [Rhodospirillaceae bacterium]MBT5663861.1 LLM class flavin-dependent oxidoreductase [Rhodospirillaceae bacterium]MBT5811092.1 LLM class flavin-dependent oxidoreductase [Rhodospirillaceae bacterium]
MRFGVFYELQLPRPWNDGDEHRLFKDALEQVVLADKLGFDYAWEVEHHFLDEYSHASAPEVFLAAAAGKTENIRLGHGIRQVIPNYNHPARTAEGLATLDLVSDGRVEFGIGEGATRLELGAFGIPARRKRALALEAAEQICNMMVLTPYPGFEGEGFSMPCRNVLPKPLQTPHPKLWMACTNRDTIKVAAQNGIGALAFAFLDPEEAKTWSTIYYDIIKSDACVPLGWNVNANLAMVSAFSMHEDRAEAIRRGQDNFEFFRYSQQKLVAEDFTPGYSDMWGDFMEKRGDASDRLIQAALAKSEFDGAGIGTPDDMLAHLTNFRDSGVDQVIFLQQAGHNTNANICESLELFANTVMPEFTRDVEEREAAKARELAPYIEAALARKAYMQPLAEHEVPVVKASVKVAGADAREK